MADLNDLLAQKADLERQIEEARHSARAGAIAQVRALMSEHGLTVADLAAAGRAKAAPARAASGAKVAPKFRNAATGETWSGRGLKPRWLTAALAAGKKLEDYSV